MEEKILKKTVAQLRIVGLLLFLLLLTILLTAGRSKNLIERFRLRTEMSKQAEVAEKNAATASLVSGRIK